jgi:phosphate transport system substrate-binding protein
MQKIFLADSPAKTWKDVNEAWPSDEIKVHLPDENSGTYDYFMKDVMKKKECRSDASRSVEDNAMVEAVAADRSAIAFLGCAYYYANKDKLRAVPVVNPANDKPIEPTVANIKGGEYAPFSRPLFIYVNVESLKQPQVKIFVEHYLDTVASVSEKVGYVPLQEDVYKTAKAHYQERLPGTCYLTKEGTKRQGALSEVYKKENLRDIN